MIPIKFKSSWLRRVLRKKIALTTILVIFLIIIPIARLFGVNLGGLILEYSVGLKRTELVTPTPPRFQLSKALSCRDVSPAERLPEYKFWVPPNDFGKLHKQVTGHVRNLVKVDVRIREHGQTEDFLTKARLRIRGSTQPPSGPVNIKAEFLDNTISDFKSAHFLRVGVLGKTSSKDTLWLPMYAYLTKKLGLIMPKNRLVNLIVDNKNWGVYWQFEPWGFKALSDNGILKGEVFGEDDDFSKQRGSLGLWESPNNWKKYYTSNSRVESAINEYSGSQQYSYLDRFLQFMRNSSKEEFDNDIFDIIDFDRVVSWAVHTGLLQIISSEITGGGQPRVIYDYATNKIQIAPWDTLPTSTVRRPIYPGSNILFVRLFANDKFLKAYNERLYHTATSLLDELDEIFERLYLSPAVRCAIAEQPTFAPHFNAEPFTARSLFSVRGLKRMFWLPKWPETVKGMRDFFEAGLRSQLTAFRHVRAYIYFDEVRPSTATANADEVWAKISYVGLPPALLKSISIPYADGLGDVPHIDAELRWSEKSNKRKIKSTNSSSLVSTREELLRVSGKVKDGRILFDNLNLSIVPFISDRIAEEGLGAMKEQIKILPRVYELTIKTSLRRLSASGRIKLNIFGIDNKAIRTDYRMSSPAAWSNKTISVIK
jgi:hypothetical protein